MCEDPWQNAQAPCALCAHDLYVPLVPCAPASLSFRVAPAVDSSSIWTAKHLVLMTKIDACTLKEHAARAPVLLLPILELFLLFAVFLLKSYGQSNPLLVPTWRRVINQISSALPAFLSPSLLRLRDFAKSS